MPRFGKLALVAVLALSLLGAGGAAAWRASVAKQQAARPKGLFGPGGQSATPFGAPQQVANSQRDESNALVKPQLPATPKPAETLPAPQFPEREEPGAAAPPKPLKAFA